MKRKNKGYVLLIVLILSVIIALIGAGLAFMSKQGYFSTRANTLFNKLQKAAHYGINEAIRRIVESGGVCEEGIFNQDFYVGDVSVKISTSRRGLLCALRAEANLGGARQVIVATTQGFYGIGTYTTKGSVSANISGGIISGCDLANNCTIPGFITNGTVTTSAPTGSCTNVENRGIFGTPPIKSKVPFIDLVSLAFNADCFSCLLGIFEKEDNYEGYPMGLGSNPLWNARKDISFNGSISDCGNCPNLRQYDEANATIGNMTIDFPRTSEIPSIPSSCTWNKSNLNLATDLSNCQWIKVNNNVNINGVAPSFKFIYVPNNTVTIDNAGNATIITQRNITINAKTNFSPLALYTTQNVNITAGPVVMTRIVAKGNISVGTSSFVSDSTLITEGTVSATASQFNLSDVIVFAKRIDFGSSKRINIQGGMLYLYTLADQERTNNRVLNQGCNWGSNPNQCAWYGTNLSSPVTIGTQTNPTLIILVNSATYIGNTDTVNINGVLFGEGVTYLTWGGINNQNYRGILVRNFPNNEILQISISGGFSLNFDYGIINTLNNRYWFVRRFECIKDDPLPYAQAIQTYHSSY
jgi:hypothetical protein